MDVGNDLSAAAAPPGAAPPPGHASDELFATLYAELKRLARRESRRHAGAAVPGPTTLVHEAYLQLAGRDALAFDEPGRFLAYAARTMRCVVIDRLRARAADKRGGGLHITSLDTETAESIGDPRTLDEIGAALDELAALEPELARVVDLKFFCGFTAAEIAVQCGSSERTVQRQWEKARGLLYQALRAA